MRKFLFVFLLIPFCSVLSVGCGSSEPTVIVPTEDTTQALEEEAAEAEEELETVE